MPGWSVSSLSVSPCVSLSHDPFKRKYELQIKGIHNDVPLFCWEGMVVETPPSSVCTHLPAFKQVSWLISDMHPECHREMELKFRTSPVLSAGAPFYLHLFSSSLCLTFSLFYSSLVGRIEWTSLYFFVAWTSPLRVRGKKKRRKEKAVFQCLPLVLMLRCFSRVSWWEPIGICQTIWLIL